MEKSQHWIQFPRTVAEINYVREEWGARFQLPIAIDWIHGNKITESVQVPVL